MNRTLGTAKSSRGDFMIIRLILLQDGKALPLILDVDMEAPVITMPRGSDSKDAVKVDLGRLQVDNTVSWHRGNSLSDPEVLFSHLRLHF